MFWYDTAANILKVRSEADDAWINVAYVDQSDNAWRVLNNTQVVNTSGTQTGLLGSQTTGTWEVGTSTTESLVSPAKVKAAVEALVPPPTAPTTGQVLSATAGAAVGGVGTYAFLRDTTNRATAPGDTRAGSDLVYSNAAGTGGNTPSGTWRLMGQTFTSSTSSNQASLWLRIS